jgi:hypothetical protein
MNTATPLHPSTLALTVVVRPTPAQARPDPAAIPLSREEEVERQLIEVNARLVLYHELQVIGYLMLVLAGLGALLCSAALILGPAR